MLDADFPSGLVNSSLRPDPGCGSKNASPCHRTEQTWFYGLVRLRPRIHASPMTHECVLLVANDFCSRSFPILCRTQCNWTQRKCFGVLHDTTPTALRAQDTSPSANGRFKYCLASVHCDPCQGEGAQTSNTRICHHLSVLAFRMSASAA